MSAETGKDAVIYERQHLSGCSSALLGLPCDCPPARTYVAVDALPPRISPESDEFRRGWNACVAAAYAASSREEN